MAKQRVDFCVNFIQDAPLPEAIKWWKTADAVGFDWLGIPDSPALVRELWVCCTAAALETKRIPFAPNVSNPISRHPSVTASALMALDELAPGRVGFGIGTGDSAIYGVGLTGAKVDFLRDYIRVVKGMLKGQEVDWQGSTFKPEWRHWSPGRHIPIYVACSGPKILKMASQEADGLIVAMGMAPENIQYVKDIIKEGCAEVRRNPNTLDIWWSGGITFGKSKEEVQAKANVGGGSWLARFSMEGKQIPEEYKPAIKKLAQQWRLATHGRPTGELTKMAKELGVYDWFLNRSPRIWGTPEDVCERISERAGMGVNKLTMVISGNSTDRMEWVDKVSRYVIPNFR